MLLARIIYDIVVGGGPIPMKVAVWRCNYCGVSEVRLQLPPTPDYSRARTILTPMDACFVNNPA